MPRHPPPASFLPLKAAEYQILFALLSRELHGYAIVKAIAEQTEGCMRLEPSNLYRSMRRLMKNGLVEESEERPAPELDDQRRRYFALTGFGRAVLVAEAQRMRELVREAVAADLLGVR
jgi:DNA-binding PadR family transcriptional regulator